MSGNVPSWWRQLVPVRSAQTGNGVRQEVVFEVTPDYLGLGNDDDYLLMPMTPGLAQQIADRLDCILPTRKMVNLIWSNSVLKLSPQPIPPSLRMTSIPVFAEHNRMVRAQRDALTNTYPQGSLVSGHKKDIVIASAVYPAPKNGSIRRPVVIYGWHQTNGVVIQPLYNGHDEAYADYSHGVRLVLQRCRLNGADARVGDLLTNRATASLLSDDPGAGGIGCVIARPYYPRRGN